MKRFTIIDAIRLGSNGAIDPKMEDGYVKTPDASAAFNRAMDFVEKGRGMDCDLENLSAELANAFERQGFINGFRYAMWMMTEVESL